MRAHRWAPGLLVVIAGFAMAQQGQPAGPAAAPPPILEKHPINKRDWTLVVDIGLHGLKQQLEPNDRILGTAPILVDSATFVFPRISDSGMHTTRPSESAGYVRYRDPERNNFFAMDESPAVATGYPGPIDLLVWQAGRIATEHISFHIELGVTSYQTRIDEERAFAVDWPSDGFEWPHDIAANLGDQLFVRPTAPQVQALVAEWTNNKPRRAKPYYLAKFLAGKVVEHYQPTGRTLESGGRGATPIDVRTGFITGFHVEGSVVAAENGRGGPLDMANLLTAVYRAAGLPARVVVGYDVRRSRELRGLVIRAWSEFYLFDEQTGRGEWIPVDIQKQREFSSRMPPIDQRWQFFGHNEEFDFVIPFAFHWHPPTTVTNAGPPAAWGWQPRPATPIVDTDIRFDAHETPIRGKEGMRERRERSP